jgi:hypothetical protein
METQPLVTIICPYCGKTCSGNVEQPKQLAKWHGWEHSKAKGVWICPECQGFVVKAKGYGDVKKL